jgi:hypothetical protein
VHFLGVFAARSYYIIAFLQSQEKIFLKNFKNFSKNKKTEPFQLGFCGYWELYFLRQVRVYTGHIRAKAARQPRPIFSPGAR